jgi:two-component system, LytTR family, sensor kinase
MRNKISRYWLCQFAGWGTCGLLYIFFYYTIRTKPEPFYYQNLFLFLTEAIIFTHVMRMMIKAFHFLDFPISRQITSLVITTIVFATLLSICDIFFTNYLNINMEPMKSYSFWNQVMRVVFGYFLFLLLWNFIYFTYHYIIQSRNDQLDKVRLESLVKELELKTIKSHINPHFIFNALNSIRALVDENPERARTAITELSNILRSSMYAEKLETTPLEKELDIVKDYLALEHIRFEDRLQVEYDIDDDTLDQPIPPMMLQTLVENAIKHGISKHVDGGTIKIISDFKDDHHELVVQNSGHLNGHRNTEGFGIASTHNRLKLLFGKNANFEIKDVGDDLVEAKVIMPVATTFS